MGRYLSFIIGLMLIVCCASKGERQAPAQVQGRDFDRSVLEEKVEFQYFNGEWLQDADLTMVDPDSIINAEVGDDEYGNRALFVTISPASFDSLKKKAMESVYGLWVEYGTYCEFPGGMVKLIQWIKENIHVPDGFKGKERVIVKFTVMQDGTVTDGTIFKGSENAYVNAEALRLVSIMPKFEVGYHTPKKDPFYFTLPITFESTDQISTGP